MIALEAFVSGAANVIIALFVGALAVASFVLPAGESPLRRTLLSAASIFLFAFLLAAIFWLAVQGAKLSGGNPPTLDLLGRYLFRTQSGRIWFARELYGIALLYLLFRFQKSKNPQRTALCAFFLSLPLVASRSLMSHAAAVKENTFAAVSADALHLVATALWAGGLPVLCWALGRGTKRFGLSLSWAAEIVARFSRLALFCVAVLVLTGAYQSWLHLQSWSALFDSPYGNVLLVKLSLFVLMAGLGAVNFFSTRPALARARSEDATLRRKALRRIGSETFLGLVILALTGLLTVLPPGAHSQHKAAVPATKTFQPAEGAAVKILSPKGGEVFSSDQVPVSFQLAAGKRGHHVHAYVDGELMGMFQSRHGTLTGIRPGRHTLELRVVADDHQTELDAGDRVEFMVK
jgi:putative copper export protein